MACQLSPILDYPECRPSVFLKMGPIVGEVSNAKFSPGVLSFNIGIAPVTMYGVREMPDWFADGVKVIVDFDDNTIQRYID